MEEQPRIAARVHEVARERAGRDLVSPRGDIGAGRRGGGVTASLQGKYQRAKSLIVIASAAKQSRVRAVDSGLLRRLRLLAMTIQEL
jgi:hypothetical protein